MPPLAERFFSKVDASDDGGCWAWTGKRNSDGYGELQDNGKILKAHRVAFEAATGTSIPFGMEVCHTCDNPACCRPGHLFLGTHTDNMRDMAKKGRGVYPDVRGERHVAAKLTASGVRAIRRDRRPQRVIADSFGISQSLVSQVKTGKVWSHIDDNTEAHARAA